MADTGPVTDLVDEALRVKNFLEDYWQFNEVNASQMAQMASHALGARNDPFRIHDKGNHYLCAYPPGVHSYESCSRTCEVAPPPPQLKPRNPKP
jgi:hypothetical protein